MNMHLESLQVLLLRSSCSMSIKVLFCILIHIHGYGEYVIEVFTFIQIVLNFHVISKRWFAWGAFSRHQSCEYFTCFSCNITASLLTYLCLVPYFHIFMLLYRINLLLNSQIALSRFIDKLLALLPWNVSCSQRPF